MLSQESDPRIERTGARLTQALAVRVERSDQLDREAGPSTRKAKCGDDQAMDLPNRVQANAEQSNDGQSCIKKRKTDEGAEDEKEPKLTKQDDGMSLDAVSGNLALDFSSLSLGDQKVRNAVFKQVCAKRYVLTVFNEVVVSEVVRTQLWKEFGDDDGGDREARHRDVVHRVFFAS